MAADAIGAVLADAVSMHSARGPSATAGACGVGSACSSSTCTRPANGAGRSAASQINAAQSFRNVKAYVQPASLVPGASQNTLASGAGCMQPCPFMSFKNAQLARGQKRKRNDKGKK